MQIHFVSYNTKYPDITESLSHSDGLAVLGVFIEVTHTFTLSFVFLTHTSSQKSLHARRIRIPESGKFLLVESGMKEFLFWNPVSTAKGLSIQESRIPVPQTTNPESSRNSRRRIHNPRIFRISLHGEAKASILLHKKARVYI